MPGNAVLVNFSGGETSPRSRGRFDAAWFQTSAEKLLNYIAELTGSARYRSGFETCRQTRGGAEPRMLAFQVNNNLAYMLEFTPNFMRVYLASTKDLITTTSATVTGVTKASQGVVTVASATGLSNGQEVILAGLVGMVELNNRQVIISDLSGATFKMKDPVTLAYVNSTGFTTYVSGGTAAVIYEIATPFGTTELPNLQIASTRSLAYITSTTQPAQKLTVDSNNSFSIGAYSRVNDPFVAGASLDVQNIVPGAMFDDFESGLGLWTTHLMTTGKVNGYDSKCAKSNDASTVSPGKCSSNIYAAQLATTGEWDFDLVRPQGSPSANVPDSTGTALGVTVMAFARFIPIWDDANNFYELRVYGAWGATCALYFNNASTMTKIATFAGFAVKAGESSRYKIKRDGSGVFEVFQNGVSLGTVTENTLGTSNRAYLYVSAPFSDGGSGTVAPGLDNPYFPDGSAKTIVTFTSGQIPVAGTNYVFSGVVGATTINGPTYTLVAIGGSNSAYLKLAGVDVDSSGWGAYVSGGETDASPEHPIGVAFYEGRLVFAGSDQRPDCLFLSRSPDSDGNSRYDDFTGGADADFACFFQLAPTGGSTDYISWARGGPDYLFIGTFGGPYRVSGSGLDIPITPSSINVRQFDDAGAAATMAAGLAQMFFVQRAGVTVRAIKVINPYLATFESADLCQNAEHIAYSALQRVVLQRGRPDAIWTYRADGQLCGMSVHLTTAQTEAVTGWARHQMGGLGAAMGKVVDVAITQRTTGLDQLWVATRRTINGVVRHCVEIMADDVYFPDPEDFFSGSANATADLATLENIFYRLSERYVHLDAAATYDGSARGASPVSVTLTPGAGYGTVNTTGVVMTAGAAVFRASDVGSELWQKPDATTGVGAGRAVITGYTSGTVVTATILAPFNSGAAIAAGNWHFAVTKIAGLYHLEGESVAVVTDGAVYADGGLTGDYPAVTVVNGVITLSAAAAVVHVGLPYMGMLKSHNLEIGGKTGPAQTKSRTISELYIRFMASLGCEYGTDLYKMTPIEDRKSSATFDRVAPVFSGVKRCTYEDTSSGVDDNDQQKQVIVMQRKPLPSVVQFIDIRYDTADQS